MDLVATLTPSGQVLVRGRAEIPLVCECRRCLERVERRLDQELALVWAPSEQSMGESDRDGDIRVIDPRASEIDLAEAIREEVVLGVPLYVVCREECKGLCPHCGADLNDGPCGCAAEERDPRWDELRALKNE